VNKETVLWTVVLLIGAALLLARATLTKPGMGREYVKVNDVRVVRAETPEGSKWVNYDNESVKQTHAIAREDFASINSADKAAWTVEEAATLRQFAQAEAADPNQTAFRFSLPRTVGVWIAAFFTLAIFSFLYKDNPLYKIAESALIGVSAAYWMVVAFWEVLVPNLLGKVFPTVAKGWALPGLGENDLIPNYWYVIPLFLGVLLLMRLSPKASWLARWPLAFIIGTTAGLRLIAFLHGDFLNQIRNTILPLWVKTQQLAADGTPLIDAAGQPVTGFDFWDSLKNLIIVIGVLACLVYFFFSFEHKGIVGKTAKLGIWFLMITFGAGFGYTVMGRIALLAIRIEFLLDDWLWLIDPTGRRAVMLLLGG
jgi:hypothetical protein